MTVSELRNTRNSKYYCFLKFGPIYMAGRLFGILPVTCNTEKLYFNDNVPSKDVVSAFRQSKLVLAVSYSFFGLILFIFYQEVTITADALNRYNSCREEECDSEQCRNVCSHFVVIWVNFLANFVSIFVVLFCRRRQTLACLNGVNLILYHRLSNYTIPFTSWSILFFSLIQCWSFYLQWKTSLFVWSFIPHFAPLYLTQCLPIVTENTIATLLLVLQLSYKDVNNKLWQMFRHDYFLVEVSQWQTSAGVNYDGNGSTVPPLKYLMRYHWMITDTAEMISSNYSVDFLSVAFCSTVRFINFLFLALKYLAENSSANNGPTKLPGYDFLVFFLAVLGKFIYLCYRCDSVSREVFGITLTYFIVLLQFQLNSQTS